MGWTEAIDAYCERTDPSFWAEPVNAVTNVAFILAGAIMVLRTRGAPPMGRLLSVVLIAIGVGSFLFHTFAQAWAAMADVVPIVLFILLYVYVANRDFWGFGPWRALLLTALFLPYAAVTAALFGQLPFFAISAAYWPVPLLIAVYALMLRQRAPEISRGLAIGAAILTVSLVARSLDEPLCHAIPIGTHLWWHLLNAVMLGWMIEVWRRGVRNPLR